jgi:hypothetical protein
MSATGTESTACTPKLCALAGCPHQHCCCGLPMELGEAMCVLCMLEELAPQGRRSSLEWDGTSHPSRRRRRMECPSVEPYGELLRVVLEGDEAGAPRMRSAPGRRQPRPAAQPLSPERSAAALDLAHDLAGGDGERALTRRDAALGGPSGAAGRTVR